VKSEKSESLFQTAQRYLPGGVNSPVRAFKGVGGTPRFISKGDGPYIFDADGNKYIDYVASWGPMITGHSHPRVNAAVKKAIDKGTSYGAPTEEEVRLARMVVEAVPSVEMVRFVNSGTEAVMSALRLARAYTKRDKIIKFEGCYHGHADMLLVQAGSGVTTLGLPDSPGVPNAVVQDTLVAEYNSLDEVVSLFEKYSGQIAAVVVEPIAGNMGVVLPAQGFLQGLREVTEEHGALLIFDEIITGFRVAYGGAQQLFDIKPDITTLGKIIGGGFPVGAYGGRKEIMEMIAPLGPVYQAGTLSGNPVAMTAGIAVLDFLQESGTYSKLDRTAKMLADGIKEIAAKRGVEIFQTRAGSMMGMFFTGETVTNYTTAKTSDTKRYAKYFHSNLERGSYFAPSQFEATFVSLVHNDEHIAETLTAIEATFAYL
jgi:glutamate-1-semialdehyde 2,1-aminomutase